MLALKPFCAGLCALHVHQTRLKRIPLKPCQGGFHPRTGHTTQHGGVHPGTITAPSFPDTDRPHLATATKDKCAERPSSLGCEGQLSKLPKTSRAVPF